MSALGATPRAPRSDEAPALERLLAERTDLWRGQRIRGPIAAGIATGFPVLDRALPWRGWPANGLTEILTDQPGAGLALILPMLAGLRTDHRQVPTDRRRLRPHGWLLLANPPLIPYPPALSGHGIELERLLLIDASEHGAWAMEQGLRSGGCAAVIGWSEATGNPARRGTERGDRKWPVASLRRLQLAAAETRTPALLLRPMSAGRQSSPALLRLQVAANTAELVVVMHKARGARAGVQLSLSLAEPGVAQ